MSSGVSNTSIPCKQATYSVLPFVGIVTGIIHACYDDKEFPVEPVAPVADPQSTPLAAQLEALNTKCAEQAKVLERYELVKKVGKVYQNATELAKLTGSLDQEEKGALIREGLKTHSGNKEHAAWNKQYQTDLSELGKIKQEQLDKQEELNKVNDANEALKTRHVKAVERYLENAKLICRTKLLQANLSKWSSFFTVVAAVIAVVLNIFSWFFFFAASGIALGNYVWQSIIASKYRKKFPDEEYI